MLQSYFKIAWRNITRNKGLFAIHVTGLTLGLSATMLIMLFVADEMSYDRYFDNADRLVRIVLRGNVNGEFIKEALIPAPVARTLDEELPEVIAATRLRGAGSAKLTFDKKVFRNTRLAFVDPNFFDLFTMKVIAGDGSTWLSDPQSVVITSEQARRFFGNEEALGRIIELEGYKQPFRVTGVIEPVPANTHFHFDVFGSLTGIEEAKSESWMRSHYFSYVLLREDAPISVFEGKLPALVEKYMGPQISEIGMTFEQFKKNGNDIGLYAQPVTDIHLYSDFASTTELEAGGDVRLVYIFIVVAVFMLIIACINFMNLSTAAAGRRMKEIGIKKVLGSQRRQLIIQFMSEAFSASLLSMLSAIAVSLMALPLFNELTGKHLNPAFLWRPSVLGVFCILVVVVTILAGTYPAFFLSSLRPINALRNKVRQAGKGNSFRGALVVFQFAVSAGLVLCVIVVANQISFIANKDVGYEREHLVVLRDSYVLGSFENAFRNQLLSDARVERITRSAFVPAGPSDTNMTMAYGGDDVESSRRSILFQVDDQYIPTMRMTLVAGRNFSAIPSTDSANVIINETAARSFNVDNDPIGQTLTANLGPNGAARKVTVIGVIKDFHFRSLHEEVAPLIMVNNPYGGMIVQVKTDNISALLSDMEKSWKAFHVNEPFSYAMLNELYNETYLQERRTAVVLEVFGLLTIFVACLGLFGLVTFNTNQRVKEIGIRKVLGANVAQIVTLLSRDMVTLVIISFVLAFPTAYYLMNKWLEGFAYRIDVSWWMVVMSGFITLVVAFCTMSFKTIQSALANPTQSLRSE